MATATIPRRRRQRHPQNKSPDHPHRHSPPQNFPKRENENEQADEHMKPEEKIKPTSSYGVRRHVAAFPLGDMSPSARARTCPRTPNCGTARRPGHFFRGRRTPVRRYAVAATPSSQRVQVPASPRWAGKSYSGPVVLRDGGVAATSPVAALWRVPPANPNLICSPPPCKKSAA
jgi:hypothetical protein